MGHIVFIIGDLKIGGAQKVLLTIAEALSVKGMKVTLVTFANKDVDHYPVPKSISRISLDLYLPSASRFIGIKRNLVRVWAIRSCLRGLKPTVVISFMTMTNVIVILASIKMQWRLIISERNSPIHQTFGPLWDFLRISLYRYADVVVTNSQNASSALRKFVPQSKIMTIRNPVNMPPSVLPQKQRDKVILSVGRLVPQKNLHILIKAFHESQKLFADWKLVIVGDGPCGSSLLELVVDLGLENNVRFTGRLSDCSGLFASASIFALPSLFEGTPNALLEAVSFGCAPIISSTSCGALDYVNDGINGYIVCCEKHDALAQALVSLMGSAEKRQQFVVLGRHQLQKNRLGNVMLKWDQAIERSRGEM
jgi:glycosyltransferase involved in cell wall biosynthesis